MSCLSLLSLSNHYYVVLHVDSDKAKEWSEREVILQWTQLYKGHLLADRYLTGDVMSGTERAALSEMIEEWLLPYTISVGSCAA
jgi:hypothetical protein